MSKDDVHNLGMWPGNLAYLYRGCALDSKIDMRRGERRVESRRARETERRTKKESPWRQKYQTV
jgi:hypothetical protein